MAPRLLLALAATAIAVAAVLPPAAIAGSSKPTPRAALAYGIAWGMRFNLQAADAGQPDRIQGIACGWAARYQLYSCATWITDTRTGKVFCRTIALSPEAASSAPAQIAEVLNATFPCVPPAGAA